ncbi:MAG: NADH-quinone oxidoreductase subunit J [Chloroflexi bacterium]|nr:NADH-quinone oxidoreductase subunit J [Chloroflexota bacterium]
MNVVFYLSAAVAIASTAMVITRTNALHALLYLVISFLAVSLIFYTLGAPFIAALEVIVYAGAIMVLFIFVIMLLNIGPQTVETERRWLRSSGWAGPVTLSLILLAELIYVIAARGTAASTAPQALIDPRQVGTTLFTTYLIGVELASTLLLTALIGAYHLGQARRELDRTRREREVKFREDAVRAGEPEAAPGELETEKEG